MLGDPVPQHVKHSHRRSRTEDRLALLIEVLVAAAWLAVLRLPRAVVAHDALRMVLRVRR